MLRITKFKVMLPLILAFAAVAAGGISETKALFAISRDTTSAVGLVRLDGSVDYVAAVNQRLRRGLTPQNNGYVLWLRVMGVRRLPESVRKQALAMCGAEGLPENEPGWNEYDPDTVFDRGAMHLWKGAG